MFETYARLAREAMPATDYAAFRFESWHDERLGIERGVVRAPHTHTTVGVMVSVRHNGGTGYAATPDLTPAGLKEAVARACAWAEASAGLAVTDFSTLPRARETGRYESAVERPWADIPITEKLALLTDASRDLKSDDRIVDWGADLWATTRETLLVSSEGADIQQKTVHLQPSLYATASDGHDTQTRSLGRDGLRQGGFEVIEQLGFKAAAARIGREAIELLEAPNCPDDELDVVIGADQMVLQIHESIGHPLELDRILGDERNYAGTSFVTRDMFGSYAYGSPLLNITFDPDVPGEAASFAFDDEGTRAQREYLIKDGVLKRGIGGASSQMRANLPGVATERACGWNRPAIDRMSNINLEAGETSLENLIGDIDDGVYMETNRSWSIDDSRNKFQFGCEYGRRIRGGKLAEVVKNPNYRGISSSFWRSLTGVGNADSLYTGGSPYCGKGEPNQAVKVGHRTPPCRFTGVRVFGGH